MFFFGVANFYKLLLIQSNQKQIYMWQSDDRRLMIIVSVYYDGKEGNDVYFFDNDVVDGCVCCVYVVCVFVCLCMLKKVNFLEFFICVVVSADEMWQKKWEAPTNV